MYGKRAERKGVVAARGYGMVARRLSWSRKHQNINSKFWQIEEKHTNYTFYNA